MLRLFQQFCLCWLIATVASVNARATVVYTYDFPGNPGSGLAVDQANGQPTNATFSDFTRTADLNPVGGASGTDAFSSNTWNQTGTIDTTQYVGFSITAAAGYHLDLTDLAFDARISATGPPNGRVALFLNGSTTAYATFDFSPTGTLTTYTFDFTDLTAADNATSAVFRFYGWNAGGNGGQLAFDNVATSGAISNVPEPDAIWPLALFFASVVGSKIKRLRRLNSVGQAS